MGVCINDPRQHDPSLQIHESRHLSCEPGRAGSVALRNNELRKSCFTSRAHSATPLLEMIRTAVEYRTAVCGSCAPVQCRQSRVERYMVSSGRALAVSGI